MAKDFIPDWQDNIKASIKCQKKWRDRFNVDLAVNYFEGKQRPEYVEAEEWITLNMIYSHLLAQLPALYSVDPYFYVKLSQTFNPNPQTAAEWDVRANTRQAYLNYLKVELELKQKARLAIQDAHFSFGALKTHYIADIKDNEKAGDPLVDEMGEEITGDDGEVLLQPETIPVNGRYAWTRIHPDNIIFGEDSGTLPGEWNWIAERLKMPLYKARKDKRFDQKAIKDVATKLTRDKVKDANVENEIIELYEVYDIDRKEFFILSLDTKKAIVKSQGIPKGIEDHPYSILRFVLRDKSPYPIPPMSQGLDPQREYNDLRSKVLTHRKRFNRKYEAFTNGLEDPDFELSKLESGEDGTIIRKITAEQVIRPISDAPLDQQSYTELALLKNDMNELLGSTDGSRGISGADSATEAGILDKRLEVKEGDRLSIVVDWLLNAAKKMDQLVQANIQRDEAVRIQGPEGEFWKVVKSDDYEDIEGEYSYSVNVGSTQPQLPQIERAQWTAFMSQVIIPMPAILTKPGIMKKLAGMFGIEDDTMIKEMQELGEAMMQGQVEQPGGAVSQPGVPQANPVAAIGGLAGGDLGGNVNGGGTGEG